MGDSPSRSIRTSHKGPRFCSLPRGIESISPLWPGHASPRPTSKAAAAAEATRGVSTSAGTVWASRRSTGSRDVAGLVSRRREPAGRREDSPLFRSGERVGVPPVPTLPDLAFRRLWPGPGCEGVASPGPGPALRSPRLWLSCFTTPRPGKGTTFQSRIFFLSPSPFSPPPAGAVTEMAGPKAILKFAGMFPKTPCQECQKILEKLMSGLRKWRFNQWCGFSPQIK